MVTKKKPTRNLDREVAENTPTQTTDTEEKHMNLHGAIMSAESILSSLDDLIDDIQGPRPRPEDDCGSGTRPTLMEVLSEGPDEIRRTVESAHYRINEIRALLF